MTGFGPKLKLMASILMLAGSAIVGHGAYLESDYEDRPDPVPDRPIPIIAPRPVPVADNALTRLAQRLEVGRPHHYRGLLVFPLTMRRPYGPDDIATLDEALRHDWVTIQEKSSASVPTVRVRNDSRHYVLLMGGEILTGGKQNRVIKEDVLLPPRSRFIDVPVYCVEQERWAGKSVVFDSPSTLAHPALRGSAARGESQQVIWKSIDEQSRKTGVSSSTRDYQAVYEDKAVQKKLDDYVSNFRRFAERHTVGAVAVSGNRIVAADLFSSPVLFEKLWGKICRSYSMDAIVLPEPRRRHLDERVTRITERDIRAFLDRASRSRFAGDTTPGTGSALRISGSLRGRSLHLNKDVIHAVLFPGVDVVPLRRRGIE